jgi:hypothetical protein
MRFTFQVCLRSKSWAQGFGCLLAKIIENTALLTLTLAHHCHSELREPFRLGNKIRMQDHQLIVAGLPLPCIFKAPVKNHSTILSSL